MRIERFEDIKSWKLAEELTLEIYQLNCKTEYGIDVGFKDQLQRASVSVMSNIAEGFESQSNASFVRYLYIAKASVGEVRSLLHLGNRLEYLSIEKKDTLMATAVEISKLISGLIKSISK